MSGSGYQNHAYLFIWPKNADSYALFYHRWIMAHYNQTVKILKFRYPIKHVQHHNLSASNRLLTQPSFVSHCHWFLLQNNTYEKNTLQFFIYRMYFLHKHFKSYENWFPRWWNFTWKPALSNQLYSCCQQITRTVFDCVTRIIIKQTGRGLANIGCYVLW